ncbi:large subunit ribosomal protein L25 [Planifilum fulgidum]|uniref:Large ribosomal subunit protein bL25 n=1 Tax=Planifilum fulgidum TaxID=201973 RepID=A0A1I2PUE8_9BACL|nr:50S ribosomal protein L25/general stress protein Ctc [Planifilum fulgidum]SFG19678.1 large subunit ribosomal protein L25 [Planifilum fulgidum]
MLTLTAEKREARPRSTVTRLRRQGRIPGVLYGKNRDNRLLHVDQGELVRLLQQEGSSAVLQLQLEGETQAVIIQELQRDPVKGQILHVDFKAIRMDEPVEKEVPLKLEGEAPGERAGGVLQQQLRYVEIRCLPSQLPGEISVDVSNLEIGDVLTLAEVPLPEGVELLSDPDQVVVSVVEPQLGAEEAAGEGTDETTGAEEGE